MRADGQGGCRLVTDLAVSEAGSRVVGAVVSGNKIPVLASYDVHVNYLGISLKFRF